MIKNLVKGAKIDQENMNLLIQKFEPLINKYTKLLKYEEAKTDLIIAFIELIYKIPDLDTTSKIVKYISVSMKNTYIKLSKENTKRLSVVSIDENIYDKKNEVKVDLIDIIDRLPFIKKKIIILKIYGFTDKEIAEKLHMSRQTILKYKNQVYNYIKNIYK